MVEGGCDGGQLGRVHGRPVVQQDAARVVRCRVPVPVGPTDALLARAGCGVVHVGDKLGHPRLVPWRLQGRSELADQDRGGAGLIQVAPGGVPQRRQVVRVAGGIEPLLVGDGRRVVVRGINQLVGHVERDGVRLRAAQVAAVPVGLAARGLHALDQQQPIRVDHLDGIAGARGGGGPVGCGAVAPGGGVMRLVRQVGGDDGGVAGVMGGQRLPGADPLRLGVAAVHPQSVGVGVAAGSAAVVVQDDLQADGPGICHDPVHHLRPGQPSQVRVDAVVDAGRHGAGLEQVEREGQADRVEPDLGHLVHHGLVAADPQPLRSELVGLQAVPVHRGDTHRRAVRADDLVAARAEHARGQQAARGRCG